MYFVRCKWYGMCETVVNTILKHGLYVVPLFSVDDNGMCTCKNLSCSSPGKHPLFKASWKAVACNKEEKIKDWFSQYGHLNFAVATGRKSKENGKYLVVVDVDTSEHELLQLLPTTFTYRTGGGGYHLWYWTDIPVKNSVSLVANKVDIRGTNGYVVIPPSKHKKGSRYSVICDVDIVDLPVFIINKLKKALAISKDSKKKQKGELSELVQIWAKKSITDIRETIAKGILIPEGVRNTTLHRLLSSDRAKGIISKTDLLNNALVYHKYFENPETYLQEELEANVDSVLKYSPYNTNHNNVITNYVKWLAKQGTVVPTQEQKKMRELDEFFFQSLKESVIGIPLSDIMKARNVLFSEHGMAKCANYTPVLFAKKLEECGFKKYRTAKGNLWKIGLAGLS